MALLVDHLALIGGADGHQTGGARTSEPADDQPIGGRRHAITARAARPGDPYETGGRRLGARPALEAPGRPMSSQSKEQTKSHLAAFERTSPSGPADTNRRAAARVAARIGSSVGGAGQLPSGWVARTHTAGGSRPSVSTRLSSKPASESWAASRSAAAADVAAVAPGSGAGIRARFGRRVAAAGRSRAAGWSARATCRRC